MVVALSSSTIAMYSFRCKWGFRPGPWTWRKLFCPKAAPHLTSRHCLKTSLHSFHFSFIWLSPWV